MKEIWKDIKDYEGMYQISDIGNVKSLNYRNLGYAKNLVPKRNNCGRMWVELTKNGCKKQMLVHRLVAMAFIDNPNHYPQINHKDENPANNCVDNLEWCTQSYNIQYTINRHPRQRREIKNYSLKYRKISGREIEQVSQDGKVIKTWNDARTIFKETGMSQWSITQCCDGKRKQAYGFKWQYAV